MSSCFVTSIAIAALIVGTGLANAQGTGAREAPLTGATSQQSAPPSAATPMNRNDVSPSAPGDGPTSTKSNEKMQPSGGKIQRAQDIKAAPKGATDSKSDGTSTISSTTTNGKTTTSTTGNAATSATAAPPAEKRTQIVSAIKSEKIQETTNVNFNISVGTAIPASVHFHPLPPRIVEIYPEWRGYEVIYVRGQYVIVRPQTREIVYIIEG
jgi:hypothetical protein